MGRRDCLTLRNRAQTRLELFCWTHAPLGRQRQPAAWAKLCFGSQAGAQRAATEASSVEKNVSSLCGFFFSFFLGDFHVCVPRGGGILSAERPSRGQKGVKEMRRLEFGTKLDTAPLNGLY